MEHSGKVSNLEKRKPKGDIRFKVELNEEQKEAKRIVYDNPVVLLKGAAGSGKAQPLDSPVLTPTGYRPMGSLRVGDEVCTPEGGRATILGVFPQGQKDVYRITFSDGSTTLCCKEHLWNVQHRRDEHTPSRHKGYKNSNHDRWITRSVEQLLEQPLQDSQGLNKWFIPISHPVQFDCPWIENKIDPYLLGCLLGDGHLGKNSVVMTSADLEVLEGVERAADKVGVLVRHTNYGYDYRLVTEKGQSNPLLTHMRELGLTGTRSQNKFIPKNYLLQSVEDRLSLLQGLLDTDGGLESSSVCFNTTSKQLAEDVEFLVHSLGGTTNRRLRASKLYGKETGTTCYTITVKLPGQFANQYFRLSRKQRAIGVNKKQPSRSIKSIELLGKQDCQCIYVDSDSHLYLTDSMIVTHNTLAACQVALDMFFKRQIEKIVITRPTVSREEIGFLPGDMKEKMDPWLAPIYANLYMLYSRDGIDKMVAEGEIEIVPFAFMRGRTFPNTFVLVDECQNITHSQTEMMLGRLGKGGKMVFCGDLAQIDLKTKKDSGIGFFVRLEERVPGVRIVTLKTNHRHEVVESILQVYAEYRDI